MARGKGCAGGVPTFEVRSLERIPGPDRRCGHGVQVVVERRHDRSRLGMTYLRKCVHVANCVSCGRRTFGQAWFFQPSWMFSQIQKSCEIKKRKQPMRVGQSPERHCVKRSGSMWVMKRDEEPGGPWMVLNVWHR